MTVPELQSGWCVEIPQRRPKFIGPFSSLEVGSGYEICLWMMCMFNQLIFYIVSLPAIPPLYYLIIISEISEKRFSEIPEEEISEISEKRKS